MQFRKAAIVGVAAGLLGGLFGVGGGLIMVPGLIGVAKMERRRAHGTSLAATLPISLASLVTYLAHGNVDWAVAFFITIGAIVGAIVGTHLLHVIPKNVLVIIFVVTILATATRLLIGSHDSPGIDITVGVAVILVLVGFVSGTLAGLLGIGGGVIMVPAMATLGMATVVAEGNVGGRDRADGDHGHLPQPQERQRRHPGGGDRRRVRCVHGRDRRNDLGQVERADGEHHVRVAAVVRCRQPTVVAASAAQSARRHPGTGASGERLTCSSHSSSPTRRPTATATALPPALPPGCARAGTTCTSSTCTAPASGVAMTAEERRAYHGDAPILDPIVAEHADLVTRAQALVFVYPTWWSGLPAILKGWLERVMVPGVGFRFDERTHKVRPGLGQVRHIIGISTYGSPRSYVRLINDNGRRTLTRALRMSCGFRARTTWLGFYAIDTSTLGAREEFAARVEREMAALR